MSIDPYAADAAFYDAIHDGERDDIGLWLSFAGRTDRPVLELGCGTGRIAVELAKAGHGVVGLDPSREMLARARARSDEVGVDIEWLEGTLTDVALEPGRFGFVLVPADVFLYCQTGEEQLAWLKALASAMHFNGRLALDLPGPALWQDVATNGQQMLTFSGEAPDGESFDAWQVKEDDLAAQTRWLRVTYEQVDGAGTVRRRTSEHQLRYVYRFEIEYLFALAGLAQLDVYGDYDLGPLTNDSERMIAIARRTEG